MSDQFEEIVKESRKLKKTEKKLIFDNVERFDRIIVSIIWMGDCLETLLSVDIIVSNRKSLSREKFLFCSWKVA